MFSSFGSEVSTAPIIEALHERGARVVLPFLEDGGMRMGVHERRDRLVPTSYGPGEPATRVAVDPASIDLIVVPGLAFDRAGNRLGYGGGHYDRFLRSLPPPTIRVGMAFAEQIVDEVPHGPGDEAVDLVVTPDQIIACRPRRSRHNH